MIKLFPKQNGGANNPYVLLAKAHRELKEFSEERKTLETLAGMSNDAYDVFLRLIELTAVDKDWDAVREEVLFQGVMMKFEQDAQCRAGSRLRAEACSSI